MKNWDQQLNQCDHINIRPAISNFRLYLLYKYYMKAIMIRNNTEKW